MTRIAIVCFDKATDIDIFLHWDILNRPRTMFPKPDETWEVQLLGSKPAHVTQAGLTLPMHGTIGQAKDYDAVVHASGPATRQLMNDNNYLSNLGLSTDRQIVGSQCSGSLILAASGCLDGLTATTYPSARADLESFGVTFLAEPLVAHRRVATVAGCLAGIKLDEWLLAHFIAPDRVAQCIQSASPWGEGSAQLAPHP